MNQDLADKFENYILGARSIVVCVHKSPDPDAVGSLVAMQKFYDNYFAKIHNAEIHYIIPDELPDHLQWMIEGERDKYLIDDDFQKGGERIFNDADLVICMDEAHRYYAPASMRAISYLKPILKGLSSNMR